MTPTTAPEFWGSKAAEYDDLIRRTVPHYDAITARLLEALPERASCVLELGCGTGNLSLHLVRRDPSARYTFVDASGEMLEMTRARVAASFPGMLDRIRFVESTFEALPADPATYDAVVAGFSLHHVAELGPVYDMLGRSMVRGGRFLSMDAVRAADETLHALHMERWFAFWRQPGNLSPAEIEYVGDHVARHDHYVPLTTHFEGLRAAGFGEADCIWRDGLITLMTATRSG